MSLSSPPPLVTIGIPTYNRYNQLRICLDNAIKQNYPNFEIIISDNTIDTPTPEWLIDINQKERKIRYFKQSKNIGAINNHQFLLGNARGKYFMWMHDDDVFPHNYLSLMIEHLEANHKAILAGPGCVRYLEGKYWLTYENWDSRGKSTFIRLKELIPDAFTYHWRFEQYMYGVFNRTLIEYKISPNYKSQFHMFFSFSERGEIIHIPELVIEKNTTNEEIEKHQNGSTYRKYKILNLFSSHNVKSIQQCAPITLQMVNIISKSKNLSKTEKYKLIIQIFKLFIKYPVIHEAEEAGQKLKGKIKIILKKLLSCFWFFFTFDF